MFFANIAVVCSIKQEICRTIINYQQTQTAYIASSKCLYCSAK